MQVTSPRPWRLGVASLSLLTVVAAATAACDADGPNDADRVAGLDLSRFGVEEIVADDGGYALVGAGGRALGRVDVDTIDGVTELDVEFGARAAEVTWSDDHSALRCDGEALVVAAPGADGWTPERTTATDAAGACDTALELGFELAAATGATPPWAEQFTGEPVEAEPFRWLEEVEQPAQVCSTVSTWVGGSSCWNCMQTAMQAFGRGPGWYETTSSCSSGTLWTPCSATFCL